MDPGKPRLSRVAGSTLAALVGVYVGAYYWLVVPFEEWNISYKMAFYAYRGEQTLVYNPYQQPLSRFFAPIHWVDRRLRPHVWKPDDPPVTINVHVQD